MGRLIQDADLQKEPLPKKFEGHLISACRESAATSPFMYTFSHHATVYTYHPSTMALRAYDLSNTSGVVAYQEAILRKASGVVEHFLYYKHPKSTDHTLQGVYLESSTRGQLLKRRPRGYKPFGDEKHDAVFNDAPKGTAVESDDLMDLLGLNDGVSVKHPGEHASGPASEPDVPAHRESSVNTRAPHRALGLRLRPPEEYLASLKK
jgi:hypothetical protein